MESLHPSLEIRNQHPTIRIWQPPLNVIKFSNDAAKKNSHLASVAVVARNHMGKLLNETVQAVHLISPLVVEVIALLEGVKLAIAIQASSAIFEVDSTILFPTFLASLDLVD